MVIVLYYLKSKSLKYPNEIQTAVRIDGIHSTHAYKSHQVCKAMRYLPVNCTLCLCIYVQVCACLLWADVEYVQPQNNQLKCMITVAAKVAKKIIYKYKHTTQRACIQYYTHNIKNPHYSHIIQG